MTKIKFTVEETRTGYSAFAEKYPAYTTGKTLKKLRRNAEEAIKLCFEDRPDAPKEYKVYLVGYEN